MNESILLVEDEEALRMTLSDRLLSEGYKVECANDGEKGLKLAAGGAYDLIILDVMLPVMNGNSLAYLAATLAFAGTCASFRSKSVAKKVLLVELIPIVNMWWAQTLRLTKAMASVAPTMTG